MSTVNNGPQIVKTSLAFVLDPTVSAGFIKTPKQINGCITWFDADDLSTITTESGGRNVRYWADKSTSNLVLTGGGLTLANEPLSVLGGLNGRNTMRFNANDYIYGPFTTSYTEFTIFLVMRGDINSTTYQYPFSINNGTNTNNLHFDVNDPDGSNYARTLWVYWNGGGGNVTVLPLTSPNTNSDFLQGSPTLITFSHTNAGSGTNIIYANGRQRPDMYSSGTQTITIGGAGFNLFMGAINTSANQPYYGDIGELIIYSRQLSATERIQIQNYLSNKWRIPLLQTTSTNVDLINRKLLTVGSNNVPVIDKCYRLNPADALGSPKSSNFFVTDPTTHFSNLISTTITMEAWVKPNSFTFAGTNTDIGAIMIAGGNFYLSLDGNGKFNAFMYGSNASTVSHQPSTTSVTRHAWNHVVWTYDGAYIRWYLNGILDKTSSSTFTIGTISVGSYLGIGAESNSTYGRMLDGYVSGCKIYGKALSAAEVSQNYESSKTEFSTLPNMLSNNVRCYYDADIYSSYIGSGTSFVDVSGNGYNATINNAPTFVSPEPKAFILNGSTQDITLPSNFNNGMTSGTWEFWVNCASLPATSGGIQQLYIQEACVWLAIYNISGVIFFGSDLNNGSGWFDNNGGWNTGARTTSTLSANTWYHVTYSWDGSTIRIYLNGNLESTTSTLQAVNGRQNVTVLGSGTTPRSIGSRSGSYFNGKFSMFRNYNTSLSTAEVLQNYNATKFRFGL